MGPDSRRTLARWVCTANQMVGSDHVTTAPTERAMRPQPSANGVLIGKWMTMRRTDDSIHAPGFNKRRRKVLTRPGAHSCPPGLEAKLLHQHIGGRSQQHPQQIGQETRATGAVDFKTELEFLSPPPSRETSRLFRGKRINPPTIQATQPPPVFSSRSETESRHTGPGTM